ncbi:MAG: phosphoribosyltransferase [Candidatus Freyrarchaeum guaymaensis]
MYYVYRISSSYDGFVPKIIPKRIKENRYLVYNWNQYSDQAERGDIVFTYFTGKNVLSGVYLISRIVKVNRADKKVEGKVLSYSCESPLISTEELNKVKDKIFTRPRGSVFVVPPLLYPFFDKILSKEVVSDIEIFEKVNCHECKYKENFSKCPIFSPDYMINWHREVNLHIREIARIISPFWIIPKQSWWMKLSHTQHTPSKFFYSFKSGYPLYSHLFAEGIITAIKRDPLFSKLKFDYIINIPLSPDKKEAGELDRVDVVCLDLTKLLDVPYIKNTLILSQPISRRLYKFLEKTSTEFVQDYIRYLRWNKEYPLDSKNILIVDDVVTDGKTLMAFAKKIHERYLDANLYAATCGIMAKKRNMKSIVIKKYEW